MLITYNAIGVIGKVSSGENDCATNQSVGVILHISQSLILSEFDSLYSDDEVKPVQTTMSVPEVVDTPTSCIVCTVFRPYIPLTNTPHAFMPTNME